MQTRNKKLITLAECGLMLALSVALSFATIYKLPWGGSVTLFSTLPVMLISIRHGLRWGLATSFLFSWFQILQGGIFSWGLTPVMLIGSLFLDYIIAFTVLGLAGLFRRHGDKGCILGVVLASLLRFVTHFIAGFVLWANYEEFVVFGSSFVNRPFLYSFLYNGAYMLPETVLVVVGAVLLFKIPQARKLILMGSDIPLSDEKNAEN